MDLDGFLADERNIEIYKDISTTGVYEEPFFHWMHSLFDFIKENRNSPKRVSEHIIQNIERPRWSGESRHRLIRNQLTLLLFQLAKRLRLEWEDTAETPDKELMRCSDVVESHLEKRLYADIRSGKLDEAAKQQAMQEVRFVVRRRKYDWPNVKKHLNELSNNETKIEYLDKIKEDAIDEEDFYSQDRDKFIERVDREIERLEKPRGLEQPTKQKYPSDDQPQDENEEEKSELTKQARIIVLDLWLKTSKASGSQSAQAKFIASLIGAGKEHARQILIEYPEISKRLKSDLQSLSEMLQDVLPEVAEKIRGEIKL